jgi:hypothetical protein
VRSAEFIQCQIAIESGLPFIPLPGNLAMSDDRSLAVALTGVVGSRTIEIVFKVFVKANF